jgi:NADP-dependent 3-hydroxy acid dehydrogenase YdfG
MGNNIEGKVIVITGASSGLGEATARHLSARAVHALCWAHGAAIASSHRHEFDRPRRQGARRRDRRHSL